MESLSTFLSSPPISPTHKNPNFPNFKSPKSPFPNSHKKPQIPTISLKPHSLPTDQSPPKINLEPILVSIDDFFNQYPFFVAGVVFIWLFVIPATQEYFRKYKFISAVDAFKKLKEDPNAQLIDIRDGKTLRVMGSPNLKFLNKGVVQVEFCDGDDEGFVKEVVERFDDPGSTTVCVLDK